MNRLFSALTAIFRKTMVVLALISLFALPSFAILSQSSVAATNPNPKLQQTFSADELDKEYPPESYEEAVESVQNPEAVEEEYEKNLKIYKESTSDKGGLIDAAKEVIEKVTGND